MHSSCLKHSFFFCSQSFYLFKRLEKMKKMKTGERNRKRKRKKEKKATGSEICLRGPQKVEEFVFFFFQKVLVR